MNSVVALNWAILTHKYDFNLNHYRSGCMFKVIVPLEGEPLP